MPQFIPWTDIEGFHNIRKFVRVDPSEWWHKRELLSNTSIVSYRAKVKLHGTNSAVQVHANGDVVCQSRERIITPENDNAGFARWVKENESAWKTSPGRSDFIVYGEWIGPGINKNVAVSQIPKKCFAVFAARPLHILDDSLWIEPNKLQALVEGIPDTYVLPWYEKSIDIDWKQSDEDLTKAIQPINDWVQSIEDNDLWVESVFGVKGTGEGLVFYPTSFPHLGLEHFTNLCFKAKGEKHKNIKTAKPAQVNAEMVASVGAFVDLVLTNARLEQGARAILGEHKHQDTLNCLFCTTSDLRFDMKNTGNFVKWISSDVEKETQDELAASGLTFKQVQKSVSDKARVWYLDKCKQ